MTGEAPELGRVVMLGGDQHHHLLTLMADTQCRTIGSAADANGRPLLQHTCTATREVSGTPLLIDKGGRWYATGLVWRPREKALLADSLSFSTKLASSFERSCLSCARCAVDISSAFL